MSEPEPNWAALLDGMASAQVPSGLVIAGPPRAVRAQLIDLVASVERACPGLRTSLWLLGDDGERQMIRERPAAHLAQAWCSTAIRGTAGDLLGALVAFIDQPFEATPQLQTMLESAAWITGLLIENSRGNNYLWLLERVPSIIYIADSGPYGAWHYASGQIEATLGFTREEWLRDPLLWNEQLHPDDRDDVITLELEAARTGVDPRPAEYRMFHRDGHVVWIRDEARLIKDALGRSRWHGVLSDITEQKRAEAELRLRLAQQAIVARLGEHALERVEISDLLQEAVAAVQEVLGADGAIVAELMPDGESFKFRAVSGGPGIALGAEAAPDGTRAQAIHTVNTGGAVIVSDWDAETRFEHGPAMSEQGIGASLTVSIEGRDQAFGVLGVHASEPREFGRGDVAFVQSLANVLADALERQTTEDAMAHLALHDSLTGLPNRVLFIDRLQHALERLRRPPRSRVAVLFIDLDNFKVVNDTLGHAAGDELLSAVAARLRQAVRPSDTVARFGGDEFGLLLEEISNEREAITMAERIAAVFARPFPLDASDHFVTTSIGIALAEGGELPGDLIRDADTAMYRAKERGRARYELFDEVMRGRAIQRLRIENDLRRAVETDELRLAFQPVVSLRDESIVGVEALIRWQHPDRGAIPPSEFIPVAEESGLIERIGRWVLEGACRQAAQWAQARPDSAPAWVAVNLSPIQLAHFDCVSMVAEALRATGLDPGLLSLELTETLLLGDHDSVDHTLRSLKALGVQLVLDDFGTGHSSLGTVATLPLDALKVDRSFVASLAAEPQRSPIAEAIVAMAKALSLVVIGEGAETPEQVQALRGLGCDLAQGYAFSPPVAADSIAVWLGNGARLTNG